MFQKILSLFKKTNTSIGNPDSEPESNPESAESSSTNDEVKKTSLLQKFNDRFPKFFVALRFFIIVSVNSLLLIASAKYFMEYRDNSLSSSLENNQTILVNVETDEVFAGSLYQTQQEKEEHKALEPELEELPPEPFSELQKINNEGAYRAPPISQENITKSKVSILFIDLGLNKEMTLSAIDLGNQFSLGFTPYATDLSDWIEQANSKDFEVFVNLPMQASDYPYSDPGPFAMLHNLSIGENLSRLDGILEKNKKIVGFYSNPGESFTSSRSNFLPILNQMKSKELLFLSSNIENEKTINSYCLLVDIPCSSSSITIDSELNEQVIKKNLQILEGLALTQGRSIGVVRAYPLTLKLVKEWSDRLNPNNIAVVPLGAMIDFDYKIKKNGKK